MTDEELIEQVARAIVKAGGDDPDVILRWPDPDPCWKGAIPEAKAAIAAIDLPARLEAARTQGWNEAIEAALVEVITDKTIDKHGAHCCCTTCELNVAEAGIRALSVPAIVEAGDG